MLPKAQEGRKTFQWNVFRREPSQGVPCGCRPTAKTHNRSASLARHLQGRFIAAVEETTERANTVRPYLFFILGRFVATDKEITNELPRGRTPSALWRQEMLMALPLKPTRDAVPRPCKPLKRLDLNFYLSSRQCVS